MSPQPEKFMAGFVAESAVYPSPTLSVDYAMVGAVGSILQVNEVEMPFDRVVRMVGS